ncbi:MAG: glycoside hydrolase family 66 protein [Muribaculaceae bacterium]|nr:glycoside hydrolase family 66 protein [Muribaculaceae bacterium]
MIDCKNIVSLISGMLLAVPAVCGQQLAGVWIGSSAGSGEFPASNSTAMAAAPAGDFHTGIVSVGEMEKISLADYGDGSSAPSRLGGAGDKEFPHSENWAYEIGDEKSIHAVPLRRVATGKPDIGSFDLWTDKACYKPGETVWIEAAKFADYPGATIRYRRGMEVIKEEPLKQQWWPWNPPVEDFRGYLVDVYRLDADGNEVVLGSIGVDVSSHWSRYPRNGYTAWFEPGKEQYIGGDVAFLNRRHINVVQFQDWHWKHHYPYCGDAEYTDIANNKVSLNVVKEFISSQHGFNMKSLFYNLGFGALENADAAKDGVKEEWYYYFDQNHTWKDYHDLPDNWKSDITFVDPGNTEWQNYLCDRNDEVYRNLDFDGFQVDQVGRRGDGYIYDYWGNRHLMADRFPSLLQAFKRRHPEKSLIMNSVSKHGADQIASSGVVDACYSELWSEEDSFMDLYWVIFDNKKASGNEQMKTIFACYMNYDFADKNPGKPFNNPGVLLTDACMFALGAFHLELGTGGNMLGREYFPNTNLHMDDELKGSITRYYDFITAYENYIYDTSRELTPTVSSLSGHKLSIWNYALGPQPRKVVIHAKETREGAMVFHLLNFKSTNSLSWRDINADMPKPETQTDIVLDIDCDRMVSRIWAATPDSDACVPRPLEFTQNGRSVRVTVPSLEYWTMLVLE